MSEIYGFGASAQPRSPRHHAPTHQETPQGQMQRLQRAIRQAEWVLTQTRKTHGAKSVEYEETLLVHSPRATHTPQAPPSPCAS